MTSKGEAGEEGCYDVSCCICGSQKAVTLLGATTYAAGCQLRRSNITPQHNGEFVSVIF